MQSALNHFFSNRTEFKTYSCSYERHLFDAFVSI